MRRRELLRLMGGGIAVYASTANGQPSGRIPRIGYLFSFKPDEGQVLWDACRQGLRDLGYVEDRTIRIEVRWADGQYQRLPELARELVGLNVDVIVVAATPGSLAVKAATSTVPVVIVAVADPTRVGLVSSLARPGGNITGLSLLTPELSGRRLQLLSEIAPRVRRVAALMNPINRSHAIFLQETVEAGKATQIAIRSVNATNPDEIETAFQEVGKKDLQAVIVFDDPVIWSYRKHVVASASRSRVPVMYGYSEFVSEGGLLSYGPHRPDLYRRTAGYVDMILKGAKPADLPIERPTKFELAVNLKTAKSLGLDLPTALLLQATQVIDE